MWIDFIKGNVYIYTASLGVSPVPMFGRRASNNSADNSATYGNSPQPVGTATTPGGSFRSPTPSSASALYRRDLTARGSAGSGGGGACRPMPNSSGSSSGSGGGVPGTPFLFPPAVSVPSGISAFSPSSAFQGCPSHVDKSGGFPLLFYFHYSKIQASVI